MIIQAACHAEHDIALGEAEIANGRALRELASQGAKLHVLPDDLIAAARTAADTVLSRVSAKDALSGRIVASYAQSLGAARTWAALSTLKS